MNKQYKSAPQAPVSNIVCHAIGDRCHGCAHYRGEADTCEYAQAPVSGFDEWWEEFSVEHFQVDNGFDEVDVIAKAAWQAALAAESELRGLERDVATDGAITLLKTNSLELDDGWLRLDGPVAHHPHMKDTPEVRYLELRGLLERHPTNETLVRLREDG